MTKHHTHSPSPPTEGATRLRGGSQRAGHQRRGVSGVRLRGAAAGGDCPPVLHQGHEGASGKGHWTSNFSLSKIVQIGQTTR